MFQADLLKDRRILITGGGTGLGQSMGRRMLELGASLVICGRREAVLEAAAAEFDADFPGRTEWYGCDIRDAGAIEAMLDAVWAEGPLDTLINNAAGNFLARTETLSPRALDAVLGIVLHGSAYMTLACGKRWIADSHQANVLSIVTTYAWTGSAYVVPSAMAKAGVLAMTRSLAVEWGPKGIRLNAIAPGPFPTKGAWDRLIPNQEIEAAWLERVPLGRVGEHRELADLAVYLISEGAGQFSLMEKLSDQEWEQMRGRKGG